MRSDEKPRIARLSRTVHVASSAGTAPPIGATCEGPLQQVRHSATVPVWRCWRWSFTVCREGRNTAAMTGLAVLRSWQFPTLRTCEIGHLRNATTPRLAVLIVFDDFFSRGESRKCGLGGQKSRFHRHRTRPPGVDDCGRGREDACSRQTTKTTPRSQPHSLFAADWRAMKLS